MTESRIVFQLRKAEYERNSKNLFCRDLISENVLSLRGGATRLEKELLRKVFQIKEKDPLISEIKIIKHETFGIRIKHFKAPGIDKEYSKSERLGDIHQLSLRCPYCYENLTRIEAEITRGEIKEKEYKNLLYFCNNCEEEISIKRFSGL